MKSITRLLSTSLVFVILAQGCYDMQNPAVGTGSLAAGDPTISDSGTYSVSAPIRGNESPSQYEHKCWKVSKSGTKVSISDAATGSTVYEGDLNDKTLVTSDGNYIGYEVSISNDMQILVLRDTDYDQGQSTFNGTLIQDDPKCGDSNFVPTPINKAQTVDDSTPAPIVTSTPDPYANAKTISSSINIPLLPKASCNGPDICSDQPKNSFAATCPNKIDTKPFRGCASGGEYVPTMAGDARTGLAPNFDYCNLRWVRPVVYKLKDPLCGGIDNPCERVAGNIVLGGSSLLSPAQETKTSKDLPPTTETKTNPDGGITSITCTPKEVDETVISSMSTGIVSLSNPTGIYPGSVIDGYSWLVENSIRPLASPSHAGGYIYFKNAVVAPGATNPNNNGCSDLTYYAPTLDDKTANSINNAFLNSALVSTSAAVTTTISEVTDQKDLNFKLGVTADAAVGQNSFNFAADLKIGDTNKTKSVLFTAEQYWYKMCIDTPEHPYSLFKGGEDFTDPDLNITTLFKPALYVNCVSYGRRIYVLFTGVESVKNLDAAIKAGFSTAVAKGAVDSTYSSVLNNTNTKTKVVILGGNSALAARSTTISGGMDAINAAAELFKSNGELCACNPGAIIGYEMAWLNGNGQAYVGTNLTRASENCISTTSKVHNFEIQGLFAHGSVSVVATGQPFPNYLPSYDAGSNGVVSWASLQNPAASVNINSSLGFTNAQKQGGSVVYLKVIANTASKGDLMGLGFTIFADGVAKKSVWAQYTGNNWKTKSGGDYFAATYKLDLATGDVSYVNCVSQLNNDMCSQAG